MRHRFTRATLAATMLAPLTLSGASAAAAAAADTHTGHSILWHDGRAATAVADGTFSVGSDVIGPTEVTAMDLDADGRGYADFDSSGGLWVTRNGVGELLGRTVLLFPAAAGYSETLSVLSRATVTPPAATPTLAETGTAAATPIAIIAMALLLGAGSVVISIGASRRQRQATPVRPEGGAEAASGDGVERQL